MNENNTIKKLATSIFTVTFLAGLILVVIIFSNTLFLNQSLRLDESQSLWQTSRSIDRMLEIIAEDVHVPLFHFILHFVQSVFGSSVAYARLASLLFFIITIPIVYLLTNLIYKNKTISLFASLFVAISPFLNWYGNEIRMYSLLTLLVVINQYFFLRYFQKSGIMNLVIFTFISILGIYTHYYFFMHLGTLLVFYLLYRKQFPEKSFANIFLSYSLICLAFIPWLVYVLDFGPGNNTSPLLTKPSTSDLFNTLAQFITGFQVDRINTLILSLWPFIILIAFSLLKRSKKERRPETVFLFMNIALPIAIAFLFSLTVRPFFQSRYLAFVAPSIYILISYIISQYQPRLRFLLSFIIASMMIGGLYVQATLMSSPIRENYKTAADYLSENVGIRDTVAVSAPFTVYPIEYYYKGPTPIRTLPIWNRTKPGPIPAFTEDVLSADVEKIRDGHEVLWLLLSYDQGYEENLRLYFDTRYARIDQKTFSKNLNLYAYQLSYD
jgi:mannosyltransferase